jgi:hypothetical protein
MVTLLRLPSHAIAREFSFEPWSRLVLTRPSTLTTVQTAQPNHESR